MMAKTKQSREEKLRKKRVAERLRLEKIRSDPMLRAIQKEKDREKYQKKLEKKQIKKVCDMSEREKRSFRKIWREKAKKAYKKKKIREKTCSEGCSPNIGDSGSVFISSTPTGPGPSSQPSTLSIERKKSGRRKVKRDRSQLMYANEKLKRENQCLKRRNEKLRKRLYRKKIAGLAESPRSKVCKIMKKNDQKEIAKRLIFGETLAASLKTSYSDLSSRNLKLQFKKTLTSNLLFLRKYKLVSKLRVISPRLFTKNSGALVHGTLRRQTRKITEAIKDDVRKFLEEDDSSRMCPGKKDFITRNKIKKQKRFLCDSMKNLHLKFCNMSSYKLSYSSFCDLKPFWIKKPSVKDRDTCMCKVHVNMDYLVISLHNAGVVDRKTPQALANYICCDIKNVPCLKRQCAVCKDLTVPYFLMEDKEIRYFQWRNKNEIIKSKDGIAKTVKVVAKEMVVSTVMETVDLFESEFKKYLSHEALTIHQFRAVKLLKSRLTEREIVIHCDFSENYNMKYGTEIQSFHFGGSRKQYTLHTVQMYYRKNAYSEVSTTSFCTISECNDHGPIAVWAHLKPVFEFLKGVVPQADIIHFLSDSPATQYRNKTLFYLLSHALEPCFSVKMATWNYFAPGHGKGAPDGIGGCLKRIADEVVAQGNDIDSFRSFVTALQNNTRKIILEIVHEEDVLSLAEMLPSSIPSFKGTMKVHQVVFSRAIPTHLKMNCLSCFTCYDCDKFNIGIHEFPEDIETSRDDMPLHHCTVENSDLMESAQHQQDTPPTVIVPGTYLLVKFYGVAKRNLVHTFRYVCCVERLLEDDNFLVQGFKSYGSTKEFVKVENDVSEISKRSIVQILPNPSHVIKHRQNIFVFPEFVDTIERP